MTLPMDGTRDRTAGIMPETGPPPGVGLSDWIGRKETVTGCVPVTSAIAIHATLARPNLHCPAAGDPMPALWHWYAFPNSVGTCDLATDGHPRLGGFLPPVPYERRMWASGRLQFLGDLLVGEEIEKTSTITAIEEKSGSAGGMVFVEVEHELRGSRGLAVRESQTIVYLPIAPQFTPPPRKMAPTRDLAIDICQPVSTALLFRYSAITFNAHRIHYDLPYARQVEHYPGLVVHGPLQANLLLAEATGWKGRRPDRFSFRGVHPMFQGADMHLRATQAGTGGLDMCTVAAAGHICMQSKAEWED